MTRYGYIGLGAMGSAMVEHLLRSESAPVTVHDIDPAAVEAAVALGAAPASSAAEVARACDVVSVCVPAAAHIKAVLWGSEGLAEGAHDGLSVLIHSTVHPRTVTTARESAAARGVAVFDAGVAGGTSRARDGNLTVLAGGLAEMPPVAARLINVYAGTIIDAGPVGAGAALKIAVNVMTYAQFAAVAAAHDMVSGNGGDTSALLEALRSLGQLGELTEQYSAMLDIPSDRVHGPLRTMLETQTGIADKDLSLALELGGTRDGLATVLEAVRAAMPAIYNLDEPSEPSP